MMLQPKKLFRTTMSIALKLLLNLSLFSVLFVETFSFHITSTSFVRHKALARNLQFNPQNSNLSKICMSSFQNGDDADLWNNLDATERQIRRNILTAQEMIKLKQIDDALTCYDKVLEFKENAYIWHRGVVLYYMERFQDAWNQFSKNKQYYEQTFEMPATEESLWMLACQKKADISDPISFSLEEPLYESRNVLRAVEKCFLGECSEAQVIETIESKKSDIWECYGKFYLGLWAEANDEDEKAKDYIVSSMKMNALREDDIWKHVIQLHTHLRGW
mmetsp:Transcript_25158/g.32696  ORF Transcript_25158/g.32696 Transcript_25158/m.32696 type:complete len:276 (+) Transcript_25158:52-879(+)